MDHSKLVFQVGNVVAKQPVDENNKAATSKTSHEVGRLKFIVNNNEERGISESLLQLRH